MEKITELVLMSWKLCGKRFLSIYTVAHQEDVQVYAFILIFTIFTTTKRDPIFKQMVISNLIEKLSGMNSLLQSPSGVGITVLSYLKMKKR